jgi:ABC-type transport system involved in Fe-S cluster assembly fused permease/ATPase subunit
VLELGTIAQSGTHEVLLEMNVVYSRLYGTWARQAA